MIAMSMEDVIKVSVINSKVVLECKKGNRITLSKHVLECLRGDLRSIHITSSASSPNYWRDVDVWSDSSYWADYV